MTLNNVMDFNIAENFAEFFDKKVSDIVNATVINLQTLYLSGSPSHRIGVNPLAVLFLKNQL